MTWIYRKADQHECKLPPDLSDATINDVWQCDTCTACYKVLVDTRGDVYLKGATPEDLYGLFQSGLLIDP